MSAKEDLLTNCDAPRSLARTHRLLRVSVLLLTFAVSFPIAVAETNNVSNIGLKLITEGLGAPMALAAIPDGSGRLLLAEQSGVIHLLHQNGKSSEQLFLDLCPQMVTINKGMEERGLLGLALDPQFKSNRELHVVYSAPRRTNALAQWDHTERQGHPIARRQICVADWSRSMAIPDGTLLVATIPSGSASGARWTVEPLALKEFPNGRIKSFIWALAEDADGELYVLANGINSAFGTRGKVFKLVPQ